MSGYWPPEAGGAVFNEDTGQYEWPPIGGPGGGVALRGTGTIEDPDTTAVVAHGLPVTPESGEVQVQPRNVGHDVQRHAVSNETETAFTVTVDPAPGVGNNFEFGWLWVPAEPTTPPPTPVPETIDGLTLWLDASSLSGFGNGDPVGAWPDLSGNLYNGTSSGANRPLYRPAGVGGKPALDFPDSNRFLNFSFAESASDWTWLFVVDADDPGHSGLSYLVDVQTGRLILSTKDDVADIAYFDGGWRRSGVAATTGEKVYEYNLGASAAGGIFIDKASIVSGLPYTQRALGGATRLGSGFNTNANYFLGRMAEVLVYNRALGTTDRDTIYDYLADKYGFTF